MASVDELRVKLHWLMGLRVVVVTLLLGLSIAFQVGRGELVTTFYALIVFTYSITIAYALMLRYVTGEQQLRSFAYLQVIVDLLLETFLVAKTGVVESPFSVLYVVTVSLGSLILGRRGGLTTAGVSIVLFGLLANVQTYGLVEDEGWLPPGRLPMATTFHTFGIHAVAFMVVGFLSGTLAEQLRRADQSLAEKQRGLNRLQAFHENIIQSISSGVFTADTAGRITSFNRAAMEISGKAFDVVRGHLWWEAFDWQQADLFVTDPSALSGPHRFEMEGRRTDGSRIVLGMTLSPLTEGGTQTGLVGVFKDLTQVRDMEDEMRRQEWMATLGEMSAGMAHEIRNPLAALAGSMQMLRRDLPLDETSARLMDIAVREATRLDSIITEFLLYARPPALNLKECDVNKLVSETLDLIRHEAQSRRKITLTVQPATEPLMTQVDHDQMKQVFWNLATNAFEAMPDGGRLTITTARRRIRSGDKVGDGIEIGFTDTGEGIKKEDLDKIFLPFFTTKKQGSGLGLAAVHRIVDLHGGWIRVDSQPGKGSRFVVCLPMSADAAPRLWHEAPEPWSRNRGKDPDR